MKRLTTIYLLVLSLLTDVAALALLIWAQARHQIANVWVMQRAIRPENAQFESRPFLTVICISIMFLLTAVATHKDRLSPRSGIHVLVAGGVTVAVIILWCLTSTTIDMFSFEVGFAHR
jgi:hypothetical protein